MLPTTTEESLMNAPFIADNTVTEETTVESGNGNIETETNKSVEEESTESNEEMLDHENIDSSAVDVDVDPKPEGEVAISRLTNDDNEAETTEANEEDNSNESSMEEQQQGSETTTAIDDNEELTADAEELHVEAEADVDRNETDEMAKRHFAGYREREDASSSDDEDNGGVSVEMNPEFNSEWADLAEDLAKTNDLGNDLNNEIDIFEPVPIDLSNDIAVNDIAAAQPGYPINPDAEFVQIDGVASGNAMPKFEKLSLSTAMNPTSYQPDPMAHDMK